MIQSQARRPRRQAADARRAEALLEATTRFLSAADMDELGGTIIGVARTIFDPWKAALTLVAPGGHPRLAGSFGYSLDERSMIGDALDTGSQLSGRLMRGEELWSDGPTGPEFRARFARFGGRSGFTLPIATTDGVAGTLNVMYDDVRRFGEPLRDAARMLCAQATLAYELIAVRDGLRDNAAVLESAIAERTMQLREAVAELRLATQAKTELLTNVSHELRTPMTAILGFSEVLLGGLDGPLTVEQLEDIQTIDRSGRHLLELIDDLIDVSRIETGRVELRPEAVAIADLVAGTVDEARPRATQKGLLLAIQVVDVPPTIVADPSRVHEILLNLLSNAVKFTPRGGRIQVVAQGTPDGVTVEVADTGIGIGPADHARVFEKFQRLAGPEYPGTGLGLAIAREFARLHGGDLVVDSSGGEGSRFRLTLPPSPGGASR